MDEHLSFFNQPANQMLFFATLHILTKQNEPLHSFFKFKKSLGSHADSLPQKWQIHQEGPATAFSSFTSEMESDDQGLAIMFALSIFLHHVDGVDSAKMIKTRELVKEITLLTHRSPLVFIGNLLYTILMIHLLSTIEHRKRQLSQTLRNQLVDESIIDWLTLLEHQPERKYLNYYVRFAAQIGDRNRLDSPSQYLSRLNRSELHHRHNIIDTLEMMMYYLINGDFSICDIEFHPATKEIIDTFVISLTSPKSMMDKIKRIELYF